MVKHFMHFITTNRKSKLELDIKSFRMKVLFDMDLGLVSTSLAGRAM